MEQVNLNIIPERETPVFHVSQGDNDRVIRCNLFEGFQAYKLAGTETILLRYQKLDGVFVTGIGSFSVTNTSNTYVDISIPSGLTDKPCLVYCKLRIGNIGAKAFYISVERRP